MLMTIDICLNNIEKFNTNISHQWLYGKWHLQSIFIDALWQTQFISIWFWYPLFTGDQPSLWPVRGGVLLELWGWLPKYLPGSRWGGGAGSQDLWLGHTGWYHRQLQWSTPVVSTRFIKYRKGKVYGANMGPPGADRTRVAPMLAPWTLLSRYKDMAVTLPDSKDHRIDID